MASMKQTTRFFLPPSLRCRLSIITREVRASLEAENISADDNLLSRCIDVAVGAVGTESAVQLIGVSYSLYKQQLTISDLEKERAGRKHFALKYMDTSMSSFDRIFCYIMFKLPSGAPISTKKIRDVIRESRKETFDEWKMNAYSTFTAIPPVSLSIKVVLQDLYIGSIRAILRDDFASFKEKDIECVVLYSEFSDYGFDAKKEFTVIDNDYMIIVDTPMVLSISGEIFAQIHKWRSKEMRVCIACDTDGLNASGLIAARYVSLATRCSHNDAVKAVKISHDSFVPWPYALQEFLNCESEDGEESDQLEIRVPMSESVKAFDRRMLENSVRNFHGRI